MKKKNTLPSYVYCVFRIHSKYWQNINNDLKDRGYSDIKCFVPTVSILKKSSNKHNIYRSVPMLFNYGFIKMKPELAYNRNFLLKLRRDIPGILSFLKSLDYMHRKRDKRRVDNAEDFDDFSKVATISQKEYRYYKRLSKHNQIYTLNDAKLNIGDNVVLHKYPFEGILAKVMDFNFTNRTVEVEIYPGKGSVLSLQLPFDNVIYTVYEDFEDNKLLSDDYYSVPLECISESEEPLDL